MVINFDQDRFQEFFDYLVSEGHETTVLRTGDDQKVKNFAVRLKKGNNFLSEEIQVCHYKKNEGIFYAIYTNPDNVRSFNVSEYIDNINVCGDCLYEFQKVVVRDFLKEDCLKHFMNTPSDWFE